MASNIKFDLVGQVALITGATSGFGERFAEILSEAGAKVVITGRREKRLIAVKEKIEKAGGTCIALPLDVTNVAQIKATVAEAERLAGPISILVNNAGLNIQANVVSLSEVDYDTMMNTNVKGMFFVAQAVAARMLEHKLRGRIVNVASIGALKPLPGLVTYSMSKAAVGMMTKGMAREWARNHIAVNALCPGFIKTEMTENLPPQAKEIALSLIPLKRMGLPQDIARAVAFLASDDASFMTASQFVVDGGITGAYVTPL